MAQRPPGSWMPGCWEFPGGKLEPDEDPRQGLRRELQEELGVCAQVGEIAEVVHHGYSDRTVLLLFFWCRLLAGQPEGRIGQQIEWVTPQEMSEMEFLPADVVLIRKIFEKRGRMRRGPDSETERCQ